MGEHATFLRNFLRHPTLVGAIAPSSPSLVRTMVDGFRWDTARNIVEFGSGTGVFTEAITSRMSPGARFFAIERSQDLVEATRIRCPGVTVYHDSVTNVGELCRRENMDSVDAIICGLPWASFSDSLQARDHGRHAGGARSGGPVRDVCLLARCGAAGRPTILA